MASGASPLSGRAASRAKSTKLASRFDGVRLAVHPVLERARPRQAVARVAHVLARLGVDGAEISLEIGERTEIDEGSGVLVAADGALRAKHRRERAVVAHFQERKTVAVRKPPGRLD
jgi:hypothetical protein